MTVRCPVTKRRSAAPDRPAEAAAGTALERDHGRPVASGGRLRLVLGFLIGALIGALLALVLPRDDGPRRVRPGAPVDAVDPVDPAAPPPLRP
jgi:hypothetical protein